MLFISRLQHVASKTLEDLIDIISILKAICYVLALKGLLDQENHWENLDPIERNTRKKLSPRKILKHSNPTSIHKLTVQRRANINKNSPSTWAWLIRRSVIFAETHPIMTLSIHSLIVSLLLYYSAVTQNTSVISVITTGSLH